MANEHAKCLTTLGQNISSVISREGSQSLNKFESLYEVDEIFLNAEDALKKEDNWDAAIVCCNEENAFSYVNSLSKSGKPILAEKPISYDLKDLEQISLHENIFVGFNRRFYSNISYLKSDLENKNVDLVKICIPESSFSDSSVFERVLPKLVYSNSIHLFDLLTFLFGEVFWHSLIKSEGNKNLQTLSVLGYNKEKINFSLDFPFDYPDNFSIIIYADERRYVLRPLEILEIYKGIEIFEPSKKVPHRIYKPKLDSKLIAESKENLKTGLFEQDKSFVEFCRSNKQDLRLANIDDVKIALSSITRLESLL